MSGIALHFSAIDVEPFYDPVKICPPSAINGDEPDMARCQEFFGLHTKMAPVYFDTGKVFVKFDTDQVIEFAGFTLDYWTNITIPTGAYCSPQEVSVGHMGSVEWDSDVVANGADVSCRWTYLSLDPLLTAAIVFNEPSSSSESMTTVSYPGMLRPLEKTMSPRQSHTQHIYLDVALEAYDDTQRVVLNGTFFGLQNLPIPDPPRRASYIDCSSADHPSQLCLISFVNDTVTSTVGGVWEMVEGDAFWQQTWRQTTTLRDGGDDRLQDGSSATGPPLGMRNVVILRHRVEHDVGGYSGWYARYLNDDNELLPFHTTTGFFSDVDPTTPTFGALMATPGNRTSIIARGGTFLPEYMAVVYTSSLMLIYPLVWEMGHLDARLETINRASLLSIARDFDPHFLACDTSLMIISGCGTNINEPQLMIYRREPGPVPLFVFSGAYDIQTEFTQSTCHRMPISVTSTDASVRVAVGLPDVDEVHVVIFSPVALPFRDDIDLLNDDPPHLPASAVTQYTVIKGAAGSGFGVDVEVSSDEDGQQQDLIVFGTRVIYLDVETAVEEKRALPTVHKGHCPADASVCIVPEEDAVIYAQPNRFQSPDLIDLFQAADDPQIQTYDANMIVHLTPNKPPQHMADFSYPSEFGCIAGGARDPQFFGSCKFCPPHTYSEINHSHCTPCAADEYCPAGAYGPLNYAALKAGHRTQSLDVSERAAVEFSDWAIGQFTQFAGITAYLLLFFLIVYSAFVCLMCNNLVLYHITNFALHVRAKPIWYNPFHWPYYIHRSTVIIFRHIDLQPQLVVPEPDSGTRYIETRGSWSGGLMAPLLIISMVYLVIYAVLFFFSYSPIPAATFADEMERGNVIASTSRVSSAFVEPVVTDLMGWAGKSGFELNIELLNYAGLVCEDECLKDLTSSGCYSNDHACGTLPHVCTPHADPAGNGGNCTITIAMPRAALVPSASISVNFGTVYTQAMRVSMAHPVLTYRRLGSGAADPTRDPPEVHMSNTTDMIYMDPDRNPTQYNHSVIAGVIQRSWANVPNSNRVMQGDVFANRYDFNFVSSFALNSAGFGTTSAIEYIIAPGEDLTVDLAITTSDIVVTTHRERMLSISAMVGTWFITMFSFFKIVMTITSAVKGGVGMAKTVKDHIFRGKKVDPVHRAAMFTDLSGPGTPVLGVDDIEMQSIRQQPNALYEQRH